MASLSDILDEDLLLDLAGGIYFDRGVDYFESGRVYAIAQYGDRISADVTGAETYQVQLWVENNTMAQDLSSPSRYLKIAQLYEEHGQTQKAIAWAEQGFKTFADSR